MRIVKGLITVIFTAALAISILSGPILVDQSTYLITLLLYLAFSLLYFNLRIFSKKGKINVDYGTSYSMSLVLFTGPLGLLIYESIFRTLTYLYKRKIKTADTDEFLHLFYNIGSAVLANSLIYYLFSYIFPLIDTLPFIFWVLLLILISFSVIFTDTLLVIILYFMGEVKSRKEAIDFYKDRSWLDSGKVALTNGLLFLFLLDHKWEVIVAFFILNYLVSRSFHVKSQSLKDRSDRDKFEQMAYTDFLTGIPNRAHMDKTMHMLQESGEQLGVIVTDIDHFKAINDSYNHAVGDVVIQHFSAFLQENLKKNAYVFRSGGEEFTMFMRNESYHETLMMIEKLKQNLEECTVETTFNNKPVLIQYTASFGLYYYKTNADLTLEKAYILADNLLLKAKKIGRNRVSAKNGLIDEPLSKQTTY
ncbi:GGDEF domain-containing protein [Virgibacillus flavescens]|uniref:GGDEF domain-containing protein n=1 Tax=Virgibacillus flavescens TaxID=1611422 RepID=UPI003D34D5DB